MLVMGKISKKKTTTKTSSKTKKDIQHRTNYIVLFVGTVGIVLAILLFRAAQQPSTLGAQTLLARGGDDTDSGGDDNSGSGSSGGESSDSHESGSGSSGRSGPGSSGSGDTSKVTANTFSSHTVGICTGPDGKTFTTEFKACQRLNEAWQKSSFGFSPTTTKETTHKSEVKKLEPTEVEDETENELDNEIEDESQTEELKTEAKHDETRSELRLNEGERLKVRTKDGQTRIDITSGGIKTRFEFKEGRTVVKAEQEDGSEVELAEDETKLLVDRLGENDIKIASSDAQTLLRKGIAVAKISFPLSIDFATNRLIVTTPAGEKELNILPDQAIKGMITAGIISEPTFSSDSADFSISESSSSAIAEMELSDLNGEPVYEVAGLSHQKFLGLIPVSFKKDVTLSASTGIALKTNESITDRLLDLLSF